MGSNLQVLVLNTVCVSVTIQMKAVGGTVLLYIMQELLYIVDISGFA